MTTAVISTRNTAALDLTLRLPYGELAVALYASDMPTRRLPARDIALEQVAAWVARGVERLGGEVKVWWLDFQSRQLGIRLSEAGATTSQERTEYRALWPQPRREDSALSLAYVVCDLLRQAGHDRRFPSVQVELPMGGEVYSVKVPARDIEMAARLAESHQVVTAPSCGPLRRAAARSVRQLAGTGAAA
ncbi:hypothetical protein ITP53_17320 [Nonomuraea sp. K274]|uniref:Uncharacterized protein n=1 Tax=Nonomuraea cypriaca TaxID=1187855 RepID=A0A931F1G9_9ACTN|nr:hypothetical protein [Nonomuraea cypriaca]MBF8187463.1 hypothetical protein [Nonomuraea cypriaca]